MIGIREQLRQYAADNPHTTLSLDDLFRRMYAIRREREAMDQNENMTETGAHQERNTGETIWMDTIPAEPTLTQAFMRPLRAEDFGILNTGNTMRPNQVTAPAPRAIHRDKPAEKELPKPICTMNTADDLVPDEIKTCKTLHIKSHCEASSAFRLTMSREWIEVVKVVEAIYTRQEIDNMEAHQELGGNGKHNTWDIPEPTVFNLALQQLAREAVGRPPLADFTMPQEIGDAHRRFIDAVDRAVDNMRPINPAGAVTAIHQPEQGQTF